MLSLALIGVLVQAAAQAGAPPGDPAPARAVSPPDSTSILRSARSAQASFESFRRRHLPLLPRGGSGACDVQIGRYCYWRGDENDEPPPPPEAPAITARRAALLRHLNEAARALPGDGWIAGQRVRYLVEAGRADSAWIVATSQACAADRWWCLALAGYAAHEVQRFADADSAFGESLAAMAPAQRCEWLDLSDLLDGELERRFTNLACPERVALARRILVAGAPLFSVSTTDLFTEHLARMTRDRMARRSAATDGEHWGDDVRSLGVRYGWPEWYSRSPPSSGAILDPRVSVTGHDDGMPYDFLPSARVLEHVGESDTTDWRLDNRYAHTGYAPRYTRSVHVVEHQLARFRHGDTAIVAAAWDASDDTTLAGRSLDASLVITALVGSQRDTAHCAPLPGVERWCPPATTVARLDSAGSVGRIMAAAAVDSGLASLELLARSDRRAARARIGIRARDAGLSADAAKQRIALSDLLLFTEDEPAGGAALTLEAAADRALPNLVIPASRSVGVFWEVYGLDDTGDPARMALTVEEVGIGLIRRLGQRLGLADPTSSLRIRWDDVLRPSGGVAGRSVRIDLSRLHGGRYRMELAVAARRDTAIATRTIEVR